MSKAGVQKEEFVNYFENLKDGIDGIPPQNILNYDERNLSDNLGTEKLIFKGGTKYLEQILYHTKGATSIMFALTAASIRCVQSNKYVEYVDQRWTTAHTI